jgi:hypothetical protein
MAAAGPTILILCFLFFKYLAPKLSSKIPALDKSLFTVRPQA